MYVCSPCIFRECPTDVTKPGNDARSNEQSDYAKSHIEPGNHEINHDEQPWNAATYGGKILKRFMIFITLLWP